MKYVLRIQYKSGASFDIKPATGLGLLSDLIDRMQDNETNDSVLSWQIIPVVV